MQILFRVVTEEFLATLRAWLQEIQRVASAALDAGFEMLSRILGT